jgi:Flp pilus assembly protein TadD/DNA-binding MarR family transcriptional regulator
VFYRFQPDAMDQETRERLFKGKKRKELLKRLTREIKTAVKNQTPRYYLIFGPRGVGKTHFVTLLYCDVKEQVANSLAVKFSEEEFSLYRVSHLLLRLLEMLGIDSSAFERMSEDEIVVAALDELKSRNKMIVLFLENLNQLLGEQMDKSEVQRLRSIFQTENMFTVVTTAPLMFPEVSDHEEPFFNFFEYIYLDELTRAELKELVKEIATIENDEAFLSTMDEYTQKLDAVYVLTGGSPRMALLLYDLMSKGNLVDVEIALFKLLDENTPYYQDIFRSLSAVTRRVFDTLIELGKPATPKEIAEKARLDNKTVNTLLRRLEKDGLVRSRKRGRSTNYEVREQLFRLWRELRREPFAKKRLSIFINFLELWYTVEERKDKFLERFEDLKAAIDEKREREVSYWFSSLPGEYKRELMPQIVKEIYDLEKAPLLDELIYGDKELKAKAVETELRILLENRKYEEILRRTEEMTKADEYDFIAWIFKSAALTALGRCEEAVVALSKSIELDPEIASIWTLKGVILGKLGSHEEALEALSKSLELNPKDAAAWELKGRALRKLERYEEALEALSKSLELNPEDADAWALKGAILGRLGKYEEALEALSKSLELNPEDADAWALKGAILGRLGKYEEALEALSKSLELNPKDAAAWELKGIVHLYISTGESRKNNYGNALENLNSAVKAFDRFIELAKGTEKAKESIRVAFMEYLKELIEAENVKVIEMALNALFEKNEEFKKLFEPISTAVEIVKSKDLNKFYELQVERREVVADIVKKLTGSDELVPEEYRNVSQNTAG